MEKKKFCHMTEEMQFMKEFHAGWENNAIYIIHDGDDTVIIDPCVDYKTFIEYLEQINCKKLRILLTHGHEDHISAIPGLIKRYNDSEILISKEDLPFLTDPKLNYSFKSKKPINLTEYSSSFKTISPGEKIKIGQYSLEVFPTPGHTEGSVIFIDDEHKCAYTGDTLFKESIGATHFPGGNMDKMEESLKKIVERIPDDYKLYPGHHSSTTMKYEKENNPYLQDFEEESN